MSASAEATPLPWLALPGFYPDALGFACRTTAAYLLAYYAAFALQLTEPATAGICVGIVAQPTLGMTLSKAIYRTAGTVLGGAVALALTAWFAQDRTMLLLGFTLWLGLCSFVAALLRDFRSYGAVLCGYTVGIIAIVGINSPDAAMETALQRVAAILVGIVCVAIVNIVSSGGVAFDALVAGLQARLAEVTALAQRARAGGGPLEDRAAVEMASSIMALQTLATYAATELPDGGVRSAGARAAIAGLLGMLSATRGIGAVMPMAGAAPSSPPTTLAEAFLVERTADLERQQALARAGLNALLAGERPPVQVRLAVHRDGVGAIYSALRTVIAVTLGSLFCVYTGWASTTGMLANQAAFTALLGMQANPSAAGLNMARSLPVTALMAWFVGLVLLPGVSGFVPFSLAVGWGCFLLALASRHPRLAPLGPGLLLFFPFLLSPSNTETFDLAGLLNNILLLAIAFAFMITAFLVIFPVSRRRRWFRIADAIVTQLRHTLRHGRPLDQPQAQSAHYDRVAQAALWLGRPSPARLAVLHRLFAFAELDVAMRRARSGLDAIGSGDAPPDWVDAARSSLAPPNPTAMAAAGDQFLGLLATASNPAPLLRAVSGLYGARHLIIHERRALHHYGVLDG